MNYRNLQERRLQVSHVSIRACDSLFCIMCSLKNNAFSVLHYVIKVTSYYLMLHRFKIHSATELSHMALLRCRLEALHLRKAACYQLLFLV